MTIGTPLSTITLSGNGVTTSFAYPFLIPAASDAQVVYTNAAGVETFLLPTQYTIAGVGTSTGGTVTYPLSGSPIAGGTTLTISRVLPLVQTTSISNQGPTFEATEGALDTLEMQIQQLQAQITQAVPIPAAGTYVTIANIAALRANVAAITTAFVQGYYTTADGGGGTFIVNPADTTSADNGGTIIVDALGNRWHRTGADGIFPAEWFGAKLDNTTDDATAIQNVITYVESIGGGTILISGQAKLLTGLTITSVGVTLAGIGPYACGLNFSNGSGDCITIGYQASVVYGAAVRDMSIAGVGKTGGAIINAKNVGNMVVSGCIISGGYNGIYVEQLNNVLIYNVTLILSVAGGAYALKWYSIASALTVSNVLSVQQVTLQCGGTGADGMVIDGNCQTLRVQAVGIIHARYGYLVQNTQASASYFPQFLFCDDLEIDGVTISSVRVEGGRHIRFSNCDFFNNFSGGGADTNVVTLLSDGTHSVTTAVWFSACRIAGAQRSGIVCYAKNVFVEGTYVGDNSLAGSGSYEGIALVDDGGTNGAASSVTITSCQVGAVFGDIGDQSYGVTAASGVSRVTITGCDFSNCVTASILDNTGGLGNVQWHGCINIDGTQLPDRVPILPGDATASEQVEGALYENAATKALRVYLNGGLKTVTVT